MTVKISGNTYPVKDQLKALGGRWDAKHKAWMVPDDKVAEAQALVAGAPKDTGPRRSFGKCADCGGPSKGYYRCYDCSLEYRDGGSRHKGGMSYRDSNGNFVLGDDD